MDKSLKDHLSVDDSARRESHTSSSLLFVDLIQAFASMIRKVCLRDPCGDEQWIAASREAGFPEEEVRAMYEALLWYLLG